MHPDSAFSSIYVAPAGHEGEPCRHSAGSVWQKVGPTGSKGIGMFNAYVCGRCGRKMAADVTWRQYIWARRWNARVDPMPYESPQEAS